MKPCTRSGGQRVCTVVDHAIAPVTIYARLDSRHGWRVHRVGLNVKDACVATIVPPLCSWAARVRTYLDGGPVTFDDIPLDMSGLTPFTQAVLRAARTIARGRTISYTELAKRAGRPEAVRAVASVMRKNPFPIIVPCHRVVRKNGDIGGFMGANTGPCRDLKRALCGVEKG